MSHLRRLVTVIGLLATLLAAAGTAGAQDQQSDSDRVQSLVQPSIVFLRSTYAAPVRDTHPEYRELLFGGERVETASRCTGFFVHPDGYVATAGHCVAVDADVRDAIIEAAAVRSWEDGDFRKGTPVEDAIAYGHRYFKLAGPITAAYRISYPTTSTTVSTEESVGARRVGFRAFEQGDIGLLKFETGGVAMPGLELAPEGESDVRVGSRITAVGFPGSVDSVTDADYNPTFASGDIQRIGTTGGRSVEVYQHGAAVSGGMSGGPVVDEDGRVIGVTSFGIRGETEAFNYATPVALLREVLADKGVENTLGSVGETYREGVEALYDGNRETALDRFEEVLKYPGNPVLSLAPALRTRAEALPEDGFPWVWVIAAIIVAAVVASAVVIATRSRSRQPRSLTPAYAGVPASTAPADRGPEPLAPKVGPAAAPASDRAVSTPTRDGDNAPALIVKGARGATAVRHRLEGETVIGREGELLLSDEHASRRHAVVRVIDGRVEIEDLGSANGTEVNGRRITAPTTLSHGDTLTLGNSELVVELPAAMRSVGGETVIRPSEP